MKIGPTKSQQRVIGPCAIMVAPEGRIVVGVTQARWVVFKRGT